MHRAGFARILLVSAALIVPVSLTTGALTATVASAASNGSADSVKCSSWNGTYSWSGKKGHSTLSECTDISATGGGGIFSFSSGGSGSIKWKSKGVTDVTFNLTFTAIMCPGRPTGDELLLSGTVNKSTGRASNIRRGQPLSATACWNGSSFSLLEGSTFDI